ncbi:DNA-directed RNA polymerase III subunit RPC3 [Electrophorus electricus]|uniref:DNA-directed RNA polymerase III subunit RPC3 n=1 Tax=Electrophorus electricus TaxID=8005 RepID=A0A4W4FRZ1_ELEEL|nr:DNA-directed RNA polymerase III subunit RPC3 [Electrophorus electricus]XP_026855050.2 DNA-directed RNA polymerase III subunit RPC3 [Electrophorus electricus]
MTAQEVRLCALLLQEHFGEVVEKVGTHLLRSGALNLRALAHETRTSLDLVKKSLCVLVQHGMCTFGPGRRGPAGPLEYRVSCERILYMLRYPRYIYTAKSLYGDTGELVMEEILQRGQMTMSNTVRTVADRLTQNMEDGQSTDYNDVVTAFSRLVETHFLQRCPPVDTATSKKTVSEVPESPASTITQPSQPENYPDCYKLPQIHLTGRGKRRRSDEDGDVGARVAKKAKLEHTEACGDEGIYWQVNVERFHLHFRHQAIISAVASKLDQTSSEIVRTMLRMSEVTTPANAAYTQAVSANEIFRAVPPSYNISRPILDQYLTLLVDDPMEFVGKAGDSGGGMYVVNLHRALANLARATLESVVQERFGSRSARIFRLLLRKRHLEQKQVEDFAMIPAKEAKDMLYTLLSENLVQLQEIPKTPDHAPSRTFYLYTVNQLPTARLLLQNCYKAVGNLIDRRLFETKENKRHLEKSQRIEAILGSLQASGAEPAQLAEVEEMITAPERQQLEALRHHINKLDSSENQVDETIFLLESYIKSTSCSR